MEQDKAVRKDKCCDSDSKALRPMNKPFKRFPHIWEHENTPLKRKRGVNESSATPQMDEPRLLSSRSPEFVIHLKQREQHFTIMQSTLVPRPHLRPQVVRFCR